MTRSNLRLLLFLMHSQVQFSVVTHSDTHAFHSILQLLCISFNITVVVGVSETLI